MVLNVDVGVVLKVMYEVAGEDTFVGKMDGEKAYGKCVRGYEARNLGAGYFSENLMPCKIVWRNKMTMSNLL